MPLMSAQNDAPFFDLGKPQDTLNNVLNGGFSFFLQKEEIKAENTRRALDLQAQSLAQQQSLIGNPRPDENVGASVNGGGAVTSNNQLMTIGLVLLAAFALTRLG